MAKAPEIRVEKAIVFDSKLDADVKKAAKTAGEKAVSETFDEAYVIKLVPTLKYDEKARELAATCTWQIYEGGGSKLFARLKQTKGATARATATPGKVAPRDLADTVGEVAAAEVKGIMKSLKAMK